MLCMLHSKCLQRESEPLPLYFDLDHYRSRKCLRVRLLGCILIVESCTTTSPIYRRKCRSNAAKTEGNSFVDRLYPHMDILMMKIQGCYQFGDFMSGWAPLESQFRRCRGFLSALVLSSSENMTEILQLRKHILPATNWKSKLSETFEGLVCETWLDDLQCIEQDSGLPFDKEKCQPSSQDILSWLRQWITFHDRSIWPPTKPWRYNNPEGLIPSTSQLTAYLEWLPLAPCREWSCKSCIWRDAPHPGCARSYSQFTSSRKRSRTNPGLFKRRPLFPE
jgi:hypothetical protein